MRSLLTLLPAAAVLTVPLALSAQTLDLPPRRTGLWEITTTIEKPGNLPAMTVKVCLDSATDRDLMKHGLKFTDGKCRSMTSRRDGKAMVIEADCKPGGKTKAVITGDFQSTYQVRAEGMMPADGGDAPRPMLMTQSATWKSTDCPGMKPGDMSMFGGIKVNIKQLEALSGMIRR